MAKRLILSFISILIIISLASLIILYARGFRFDTTSKKISSTGILSVSSYPQKASIYVDDKLTSATDASFSLPPGWYEIKISKDGYQSWQKRIRVQGEVVSQIDALLIPNNPSFKALTTTGVKNPILSPSSTKVAYLVTNQTIDPVTLTSKNGLYMLELKSGPLGNQPEPKQVFIGTKNYVYDNAQIIWSADEKEILLTFKEPVPTGKITKTRPPDETYLISVDNPLSTPPLVTLRVPTILSGWQAEARLDETLKLDALNVNLKAFLASTSANLHFSPDETKILYEATSASTLQTIIKSPLIGTNPTSEKRIIEKNNYYIYDIKEDKNFHVIGIGAAAPIWYTDSKHLIIINKDKINLLDYDGTNEKTVYSGPFMNNIVLPWSPGGKIVILASFNSNRPLPDLYELDLR